LCQVCFKRDDLYNSLIKPDQRNSLHHCRGCLLSVHKLCYGLSGDTDRMFYCERCCDVGPMAAQVRYMQTCCVCSGVNGAIKRVGELWVHVTCALFSTRFRVASFKEMRFQSVEPMDAREPLDCLLCHRTSNEVLSCQSCTASAHAICSFGASSLNWDCCSLFAGQRQLTCPEHYSSGKAYCICKRNFADKEVFMICCDVCDTWYHGDCVGLPQHIGATLETYTCALCQSWLVLRSKLGREDKGAAIVKFTLPEHLINLGLVDYLLLARVFEVRAARLLKTPCAPEDLRDLLSFTKAFFFTHPAEPQLQDKVTAATSLLASAQELFQKLKEDKVESSDLPAIAALTEDCNRLGLALPQLARLKAMSEHVELVSKVKDFASSSQVHTLVEAKAFYETLKERLGADSQWLIPLNGVINCADMWIADVKEAFAKSQKGEHKLTIDEARQLLADGKSLILALPQELRTVDEEIKAAEHWDKNLRNLPRPYDPTQLTQLFDETNVTTVWTHSMTEAKVVLDRYNLWYGQALRYLNPTELTPLPILEEVQQHIKRGETDLGKEVDVREARKQLEAGIADALRWQETAQMALAGPSTQQRMSYLLREGKSLMCVFPELEAIERRAGINKKISDVIHRKHKEEDLLLLLREAKELCADEEFVKAVEAKLSTANEMRQRVNILLEKDLLDPAESYTQLLEELKNSRTDLPDERTKLEDGFKSLKWLQTAKEALEETEDLKESSKRKATDLETYKMLIAKGQKITYKHPRAAAVFEQLAGKYWDLEYHKLTTMQEVRLEDLQALEAKMTLVTHDPPESLVDFAHRIKGINKSTQYFETLLGLPLEQVFSSDLTVLKEQIQANRKKLADEGVVFPEKFCRVLPWVEWVDWCVSVQQILADAEKPSVNRLYEVNEEAINLGIPLEVATLKELNEHISFYEKWLSRYSAYIVIKKYYKSLQVAPAAYLKRFQEKPKTSFAVLQQLVDQAEGLKCRCDEEIAVLQGDIAEALAWAGQIKEFLRLHPYEELLQACKRSVAKASETESYRELQRLTQEYLFSIFVDIEDYTNQLCTYSWHLTALQLLQQSAKINAEEWDEFYANLEFGNRDYQDQIIFDRVRRQQSLRMQIEEDIAKLMQAEKDGGRQLSLDDINQLNEQVMACKVMLKQDSYIQELMQRAQALIARFQVLLDSKGWLSEFKELQGDLTRLPIEIPDITQKLKEVIDKSTSLGLRFKILKESAVQTRSKIERFKVENILKEYQEAPAKVPEAEQFAESLEQAKIILQEGQKASDSTSLELVTHTLSRLDSIIIHMGPEETALKMVLWKLKVKLALDGQAKLPFQVLCGWYNEGLQMKDLDTLGEIGELEKWVRKGEEMKTKLAAAENLEALERVTAEAKDLPLDLTQSIIEQRTRITLVGTVPAKSTVAEVHYEQESAYIPTKRVKNPNAQDSYHYGALHNSNPTKDPIRASSVSAIENVLACDPTLTAALARKLALKLENILSSTKGQGRDYNKAVVNIQRVLDRLQDFEGFGDKLAMRDIKCHRLCELHLSHLVRTR